MIPKLIVLCCSFVLLSNYVYSAEGMYNYDYNPGGGMSGFGPLYSMPTQQFMAQDGDTEQGGYQYFQGQVDYSRGLAQQQQQQNATSMQIQNQMEQEYQQQISAQQAQGQQ